MAKGPASAPDCEHKMEQGFVCVPLGPPCLAQSTFTGHASWTHFPLLLLALHEAPDLSPTMGTILNRIKGPLWASSRLCKRDFGLLFITLRWCSSLQILPTARLQGKSFLGISASASGNCRCKCHLPESRVRIKLDYARKVLSVELGTGLCSTNVSD